MGPTLTGQQLGPDGQEGRQGLHMAQLRIMAESPAEAQVSASGGLAEALYKGTYPGLQKDVVSH